MDDAELVRRAYEDWNEGGVEAALPHFAEHIELNDPPELPDCGTWYGVDAVRARLDAVGETLGTGGVRLEGVEPVGHEVLVSLAWQTGAGEGSGLLGRVFHRARVDGGRITRIRVFLSEQDARAAS